MKLVCSLINRKVLTVRYSNNIEPYIISLDEFIPWDSKFASFNAIDFEQFLPPDVQIRLLKSRINKLVDRL